MASIKVVGSAVVITSDLELEDIKLVQSARPKALKVFEEEDGKKNLVFCIGAGTGKGSLTEYGIVFGRVTNDGYGNAQFTQEIDPGDQDIKEFVAEHYGLPVMYLNKLEESLRPVISDIKRQHQNVLDSIELL